MDSSFIDTMAAAFGDLTEEGVLSDPDRLAVRISLDRDTFANLSIGVQLKEIKGEKLFNVLAVARKYKFEVREENGWLRLSRGRETPEHRLRRKFHERAAADRRPKRRALLP